MLCSMRISQDIRKAHGEAAAAAEGQDEIAAGMAAKSAEFAAAGNRVYLPLTD